jgi:hypothetical protein
MNRYGKELSASEALGFAMIWDGTMGTLLPVEHCLALSRGPQFWRNTMEWFAARPQLTRGLSVAELGAGLWLTAQSKRRQRMARRHEPIS